MIDLSASHVLQQSKPNVDLLIVRENTECLYVKKEKISGEVQREADRSVLILSCHSLPGRIKGCDRREAHHREGIKAYCKGAFSRGVEERLTSTQIAFDLARQRAQRRTGAQKREPQVTVVHKVSCSGFNGLSFDL
jgi:isocitrate/isopropylmalate dehydrogenase